METVLVKYLEGETVGTYAISMVGDPANEFEIISLSKQNLKLRAVNREKRLFFSAVLIPNQKILRTDKLGNPFYIMFEPETIRMAQQNFIKKGYQNNSTLEHDEDATLSGITFVEHWIKEDENHDKSLMYTDEKLALGTWCTIFRVDNDEIMDKIESGEINGVSIDGEFKFENVNLKSEFNMDFKKMFIEALAEVGLTKKQEVKLGNIPFAEDETKAVYFDGETLVKGQEVFIDEAMTEPAPDGTHKLMTVEIKVEGGVVTEIMEQEAEEEVEAKEEEKKDLEMSDELKTLIKNEVQEAVKGLGIQMAKVVAEEIGKATQVVEEKKEEVSLASISPESAKEIKEPKNFKERMFNKLQNN
jgi:hypothetical protein